MYLSRRADWLSPVASQTTSPVAANDLTKNAQADSIAQFEAQVRTAPTDSNRMDLPVAYINANPPGRAIPLLQAAVATDPNNAAARNNLCLANAMQKDYRTAIEEVGKAPTMSSRTRWRVRGSLL